MRVDYKVGWNQYKSEWVCLEHDGYARQKAIAWWKRRSSDPVPDSAHDAVVIANHGGLAVATSITVRCIEGDPFERIIDWELGPVPESISVGETTDFDASSIPF
jgi:DNA repair protein RadD